MTAALHNTHTKHTDNASVIGKVELRKMAIRSLKQVNVLDCFAGNNVLWSQIQKDKYLGIEKEKGKGKNLYGDNAKLLEKIDLSGFTVIDLDSYGIPAKQIEQIMNNPTFNPHATVIIYTAISNSMSALSSTLIRHYEIGKMYKKSKTMFNARAHAMFHGYLYSIGVRELTRFELTGTSFKKEYGYFVIDEQKS